MKHLMMAVLALSLVVLACGDKKEPTCSATGTWQIADTRSSSSGGYCDTEDFATSTSTVQLTYDGASDTFTWTEDGDSFAGTIDRATCEGTVTAVKQVAFTDPDDQEQILTMTALRSFTLGGNYAGTAAVTIEATGGLDGVPCTIAYSSTGTRQ